jgi:site-specific recombinase XerD
LEQIFTAQMRTLGAVLQPSTVRYYQTILNRFLRYLHTAFPQVRTPRQLRRDPHMLGWLRSLTAQTPPLSNRTRRACVICLRRLLEDLASYGHPLAPGLLLRQDLPPQDLYLPQALSPENDHLLQQELRCTDDLRANALLLLRATGMRIGECLRLRTDCLRHLGADDWAIHVPLGKLHTERWVPVDADARHFVARILTLRGTPPSSPPADSPDWLLRQANGRRISYQDMRAALQEAARRAGCPVAVRLHRLRHTYASEMLRAGASLPAVKEMLGHKNIRMTMVYIQITQNDLQREYHQARQNSPYPHTLPPLPAAATAETITGATIPAICRSFAASRHLLEMYRRQLGDEPTRRKIGRLLNRLAKIAAQLIGAQK